MLGYLGPPDTASGPRFGQLGSFCTFRPLRPRGVTPNWVRFAHFALRSREAAGEIGFVLHDWPRCSRGQGPGVGCQLTDP
jgi:hypothetical protein